MKPHRKLPPDTDIVAFLKTLDREGRRAAIELLGEQQREALDRAWAAWAHPGQLAPAACADGSPWATWVIMAGRGFGKTLAGAQWITARVAAAHDAGRRPVRIALVGATIEDARRVMVEGPSGLIAVAGRWLDDWSPSRLRLTFRGGSVATLFSGATPYLLRGPEHHYAWCDELAKWEKAEEAWDMLQLGLRLAPPDGEGPRAVVTTTPRSEPLLAAIMADPATVVTGGPTAANPHLPRAWQDRVHRLYAGTSLGRQELGGEFIPNLPGALWTVELIERCRIQSSPSSLGEGDRSPQASGGGGSEPTQPHPDSPLPQPASPPATSPPREGFARILIAVDPPTGDGTCGIVACAREGSGLEAIAHVLADHSVTGRSPEGWAGAVAAAAEAHGTCQVVAERNQGGDMVRAILHAADPRLRVRLVHAAHGKVQRAEPVAHLFEAGRVRFHGTMPELEAELLRMIAGGGYAGPPGASPDRADAMVWGISELMKERAEARVRVV